MVNHAPNPNNTEWGGWPNISRYGQGFKNALVSRKIINDPPPLYARNVRNGETGYRNRFGTTVNPTAIPLPLIAASMLRDYNGQLPLSSLSLMVKPKPWEAK